MHSEQVLPVPFSARNFSNNGRARLNRPISPRSSASLVSVFVWRRISTIRQSHDFPAKLSLKTRSLTQRTTNHFNKFAYTQVDLKLISVPYSAAMHLRIQLHLPKTEQSRKQLADFLYILRYLSICTFLCNLYTYLIAYHKTEFARVRIKPYSKTSNMGQYFFCVTFYVRPTCHLTSTRCPWLPFHTVRLNSYLNRRHSCE